MPQEEGTQVRETPNYRVFDNGNDSIIIVAKTPTGDKPRISLYQKREWDRTIWRQLRPMNDSEFDGSCALELGVG